MAPLTQPKLDEIQKSLAANLQWSPMDFIKGISITGDMEYFVAQLTKEADNNVLRFIANSEQGSKIAVFAEKLEWDSEFFGYPIAKLNAIIPLADSKMNQQVDYTSAAHQLIHIAKEERIRYLFAAIDSRDLLTLQALGELGFALIETRVYYHMDIRGYEYPERFAIRIATEDDIETLGRTAQKMINPYDRFHADPFITSEDADRLMYRWVEASIRDGFADTTIVPDLPQPKAFCTIKYHKNKWSKWGMNIAQPVFSAVSRENGGWYRRLISEINYHLLEIGAEHSFLATQITNRAVIRVWESLGYRFGKGEHILRLVL